MDTPPHDLDDWVTELSEVLNIPNQFVADISLILDVARDAAHSVARPAAPITTFLVGYAAALNGGTTGDVEGAARAASLLAATRARPES